MKPVIIIADDFFKEPLRVREAIVEAPFADFKDLVNPVDGVVYPGINLNIPSWIHHMFHLRLEEIVGGRVQMEALFARATLKGNKSPHTIHSDKIMGQYSAHVYISLGWHDGAGTSFWSHVNQGYLHGDLVDEEALKKDIHNPELWTKTLNCQGVFNRILIHDARYFHCIEPVEGWGDEPNEGRVVLTCFFNKGEIK